jgi:ankyrin repeat protein
MERFAIGLVLTCGLFLTQARQRPAPVEIKDSQIWEHRIGEEQVLRLTPEELKAAKRFSGSYAFVFDVVVSESGLVESATQVKNWEEPTDGAKRDEALALVKARSYKPWLVDGVPVRAKVQDYVVVYPPERRGPEVPFPAQVDRATLEFGLERTSCYGSCPAYKVTIAGDGTVNWYGGAGWGAKVPGHHVGHVPEKTVTELLDRFRAADFLSALPHYHSNWTDNPTQTLTLRMGDRTWTVVDYDGLKDGLPVPVRELEAAVDEAADTKLWLRGGAGLAAALNAEHWDFGAATADNMLLYNSSLFDRELVEQFLKAKAPVAEKIGTTTLPVCSASGIGDLDLVKRMLEPVKKLPAGVADICLVSAAGSGNLAMVDFWVAKGGDPTVKSQGWGDDNRPQHQGPLESAIFSGNPAVVQRLLDLKADAKGPTSRSEPMLTLAIQNGGRQKQAAEIVEELLKAGADPNAHDTNMEETPVFAACYSPELIKPLLAGGADIEARDRNGNTPLIRYGFMEPMVRELLADGADPTAVAKNGDTALKTSRQYQCPACTKLIEEAIQKKLGTAAQH